eukprot:GHVT01089749.1.p1 GENE.GHVT01089749.1~~GHVT01089749.1.p1  ORF type:complete len:389 (+),score=81.69 GHVT01089749.1:453-1619(+)
MCTSSLTKPTKPNAENEKTIASSFSYFLMLSSTNWKLSLSVNLNDAYNLATIVCFVPPPLPSTPPPSSFSSAFSFSLFFLHPPPFLAFVHFSETMAALVRLDKSSGARERHEFFFVSPVKIVLTLKMNDMETFVEMQTCEVLEAGWECDSKRENQICLRLHFPTLHETLKCGRDADKVTIKLTKRSDSGQAVLAVAVSDKSLAQVLTSQECAVTVSQEALEEAKNQQIPTCPWNLKFFNGRKVEHVLDIMQKIGASVIRWTASRSAAVASQPTGSDVQFELVDIRLQAFDDLLAADTIFRDCQQIYFPGVSAPTGREFERSFATNKLLAAFKFVNSSIGKGCKDFSILCSFNDDDTASWGCLKLFHPELNSLTLSCILPTCVDTRAPC